VADEGGSLPSSAPIPYDPGGPAVGLNAAPVYEDGSGDDKVVRPVEYGILHMNGRFPHL